MARSPPRRPPGSPARGTRTGPADVRPSRLRDISDCSGSASVDCEVSGIRKSTCSRQLVTWCRRSRSCSTRARPGAAVGHVHVRIRAVGHECRRLPRHLRRDVGVEVEARDDRHCRTDHVRALAAAFRRRRRRRARPPSPRAGPGRRRRAGPRARRSSSSIAEIRSNASRVTRPDGCAEHQVSGTSSWRSAARLLHEPGRRQVDAGHRLEHRVDHASVRATRPAPRSRRTSAGSARTCSSRAGSHRSRCAPWGQSCGGCPTLF